MIRIAQTGLLKFEDLSPMARGILERVPLAEAWVKQLSTETTQDYEFSNTAEFIEQVVSGLHGSSLVNLTSDLRASTRALAHLDQTQLDSLLSGTGNSDDGARNSTLEALGWLSQHDLTALPSFLERLNAQNVPCLNQLSFEDALAVHSLVIDWASGDQQDFEPNETQKSAVSLATELALTAREFVRYCRAFTLLQARAPEKTTTELNDFVTKSAAGLANCLSAMVIGETATPDHVLSSLIRFSNGGQRLGFCDPAAGLFQLARDTDFSPVMTTPVHVVARGYLDAAQALARSQTSLITTWAQHGQSALFTTQTTSHLVHLRLDVGAGITVAGYAPLPQQDNPPSE